MRAPLPFEVLHAIRVPTFQALFASAGFPPGVTADTTSLSDIAAAVATSDLPAPLARALFTVWAFASDAGRADLYAAADALGYRPAPHARWPEAASPADLIAALLASAAAFSDPALTELLAAAQILRDRSFRPFSSYVYAGSPDKDPGVGEPTQYEGPLRARFATWASSHDFGEVLPITARQVAGVFHYAVVHEDRKVTHVTARGGAPQTHRPLRSHHVTYERAARRLTITTDCPEAVTPLAALFGAVLFDDPRHFLETPAVDLWKLQEHGAAALAVRELSLKLKVNAIGGTWYSGKGHAITPRGRDLFKALARYKIRIEGGRLDLVTLRATFPSHGTGPSGCDVVLRPPHQVTVSEPEAAPLVGAFLEAAKITSPEPRPRDFFSLQPWIDAAAVWTAAEGEGGFAALLEAGLLKADPSNRSVASPEHPHAGRTSTAYPLGGTRYLALSPDPTVAPFVIEEQELVAYALEFGKLAAFIARALDLEGPAARLDDDGVLFCGLRALGTALVYVFLLTRPIRRATAARLRDAAGHGHAILVTPAGRMDEHGLRQLAMPKLSGPWEPLLGAMVRSLRLENEVDTPLYAPTDARIVVHRKTTRVWIDGVRCDALDEADVRLLEIFIAHGTRLVETGDIADHVSQGHPTVDTTRRAIQSFLLAAKKSFKARKVKAPKDLASFITMPRHGRYTLNVKGFVD